MHRWWIASRSAAGIVADRPVLWLPGALAWVVGIGWLALIIGVARPPTTAGLTFLGAGIFASGAWPWNAVAIGLAVLIVTLIAIGLAAVAEAAEATEFPLGVDETLFGRLERLLALASEALVGAPRPFAWSRPRLGECKLLGGRSLERSGETCRRIELVERAPVLLAFEWMIDEIEARFRPCPRAGDVTPLAQGSLLSEEDEGALDAHPLCRVTGERVGVIEMVRCVGEGDAAGGTGLHSYRKRLGCVVEVDD